MKLEPWEIELQNQLGSNLAPEVPKTIPVPVEPEVVSEPTPVVEETKGPGTWAFLILFTVLALSSLYIYDGKTGGKMKSWATSRFHTVPQEQKPKENKPVEQPKVEFEDAEVAKLRTELYKLKNENKAQYDAVMGKLNAVGNKVVLMGLLLNENFNIIRQSANYEDMVFFNKDWTLNKMPKYIDLSDDDREYLRKYVNQN
jgi:hypothetical protein